MSPWHDVVAVVIVAMMCGTMYLIVEKETMERVKVRLYASSKGNPKPAVYDDHIEFDGTPGSLKAAMDAIISNVEAVERHAGREPVRTLISVNPGA